jgi:hypothetical protein
VTNRDIVETVARWQNELGGHLAVVGDLNVHAGSTEMEEWEATLRDDQAGHRKGPLLLADGHAQAHGAGVPHDTGPRPSTAGEHGAGAAAADHACAGGATGFGVAQAGSLPASVLISMYVHVPQMTKRRRKKVVSRLTKMEPAAKALLV